MRVAICIGTFRRPDLLRKLLMGLARLTFQKAQAPNLEVIVVDNDALGSAREVCQAAELPYVVKYVIEPRRGIAHVRNRAVREAAGAEFLAFIDDDEIPTPAWLDELLCAQSEYQADVVAGPVLPAYVDDVPGWIKKGGFFDRPEFPTGTLIEKCGAGNALIAHRVFTRVPGFDERFQLTGGEDTHFFLRVRLAGHSIVWSKEAIAYEAIPSGRTKLSWILRRAYQTGNCWARCESSLDIRKRVRVVRLIKALGYIVRGLAGALVSLLLGRTAFARSLQCVCVGFGMFAGLAGRRHLAYQNVGADFASKTEVCGEQAQS